MRYRAVMRIASALVLVLLVVGCSDDPPPPSPTQKAAGDTLDFCKISKKGLSCDGDKLSYCGQCINASSCQAIAAGVCKADCPGMEFKPN